MRTKKLKYDLSENALKSFVEQTDNNAILNLSKTKSKVFLVINKKSKELTYIIPFLLNDKYYASDIPNPTSLFFSQAIENADNVSLIQKSFDKNILVILNQDNNSDLNINLLNPEKFNQFLMYKISSITSLISAVESFINAIIPENFEIENLKKQIIGKSDIERFWDLKSKLKEIVPKIKEIKDTNEYFILIDKFIELSKIRNEFIHLKTKKDEKNLDPFLKYFEILINLNLEIKILEVKKLINYIEPNYID